MIGLSIEDIAWLAGIIEGEGSILLRRANYLGPRNVPYVTVAMNDEDVVARIAILTGMGTISSHLNDSGSRGYRWQCSRRDEVPELLRALRPWMGARRMGQIDLVLAGAAPYGYDGTARSRRVVVVG